MNRHMLFVYLIMEHNIVFSVQGNQCRTDIYRVQLEKMKNKVPTLGYSEPAYLALGFDPWIKHEIHGLPFYFFPHFYLQGPHFSPAFVLFFGMMFQNSLCIQYSRSTKIDVSIHA